MANQYGNYTIWDKTFDDYVASHGGNWDDPDVRWAAEKAAEAVYNAADPNTRDAAWGKIYEYANDEIANRYEQANGQGTLFNKNKEYKIQQDKRKDNDEGEYKDDDGNTYHYVGQELTDSNGNIISDAQILEAFNTAKSNSEQAFGGKMSEHNNMSDYDYYTKRNNINYEDVASQLLPSQYHVLNQEGSGHIRENHKKGINDLNLRYSPDVDPYTQQDANDLANIITNDDLYGWGSHYSKENNTVTKDDGSVYTPQAYANHALLENPIILADAFENGDYSALTNLAEGDFQTLYDYANAITHWGGGYLNPSDLENFYKVKAYDNTKDFGAFKEDSNSKMKDAEAIRDESDDENERKSAEQYISQNSESDEQLNQFYDSALGRLIAASLLDSLGKRNNFYLNNPSQAQGDAMSVLLNGGYGKDLYQGDNTKSNNYNFKLKENYTPEQSSTEFLRSYVPKNVTFINDKFGMNYDDYLNDVYGFDSLGWLPKEDVLRILDRAGYNVTKE